MIILPERNYLSIITNIITIFVENIFEIIITLKKLPEI